MGNAPAGTVLAQHAADRIREQIRARLLKPGELIGTEAGLAVEFGMSRGAVREGVGRLRGLGLVDSRPNRGVIVAQSDPAEILGLVIPQYVVDHATFFELVQLRCALELGSVETAVENATKADIERLKHLSEQHRSAVAHDPYKAQEIDIEFHETILSATRNDILKDMHSVITAFFRRGQSEYPGWSPGDPEKNVAHSAIAEAFAHRNAERARELLKAHLQEYKEKWEKEKRERM